LKPVLRNAIIQGFPRAIGIAAMQWVLDLFDKKFNTTTNYIEDINDNEEFFGKFQATLQAGQDIGRDLVTLTDWMAGKWVALGYAERLDKTLLPNVEANQSAVLRGRSIDPGDDHLVPWQSGLTGLAYNAKVTKEIRTIDELLTRPDLKGKIVLLDFWTFCCINCLHVIEELRPLEDSSTIDVESFILATPILPQQRSRLHVRP